MRAVDSPSRLVFVIALGALLLPGLGVAAGQPVPRPFPRPGGQPADPPAPTQPVAPPQGEPPVAVPVDPAVAQEPGGAPSEQTLGMPIYPTATYLTSYSAGRGQRYYLFGSNLSFAEMVAYYRNVLNARGDMLFEQPPTYMFEVGRYDEDRMAFPPSITVKDFTWTGSPGYANPNPGEEPTHFATILQIVPPPPGVAGR
jgi:hypothetical protein